MKKFIMSVVLFSFILNQAANAFSIIPPKIAKAIREHAVESFCQPKFSEFYDNPWKYLTEKFNHNDSDQHFRYDTEREYLDELTLNKEIYVAMEDTYLVSIDSKNPRSPKRIALPDITNAAATMLFLNDMIFAILNSKKLKDRAELISEIAGLGTRICDKWHVRSAKNSQMITVESYYEEEKQPFCEKFKAITYKIFAKELLKNAEEIRQTIVDSKLAIDLNKELEKTPKNSHSLKKAYADRCIKMFK